MALSDARRKLVRRLHRRKTREREGLVLVEGPRAVSEVVDAGAVVRFALTSPRIEALGAESVLARLSDAGAPREEVSDAEMRDLADTEAPQGLLTVVEQPEVEWPEPAALGEGAPPERWLVLDALQDPGNVGTLVRAAAAFACAGVLALDGTADPWGTRAVRASAGAVFRLPIHTSRGRGLAEVLDTLPHPILAAEMGGDAPGEHTGARWSLIVGNEGAGIRPALLDAADRRVAVPMPGGIESLNAGVAGAILLYALTPDAP